MQMRIFRLNSYRSTEFHAGFKVYTPLMKRMGYDTGDRSTDIETAAGIGNVACAAVLEFRHRDKSNQLGDLATGPYSDWSGYRPVNSPGTVPARSSSVKPLNPEHWQPLTYTDSTGAMVVQMFVGAQWCNVAPFAMTKGDEFRALVEPGPPKYGSPERGNCCDGAGRDPPPATGPGSRPQFHTAGRAGNNHPQSPGKGPPSPLPNRSGDWR